MGIVVAGGPCRWARADSRLLARRAIGQAIRRKAWHRLAGSAPIQREEGQRAPQDDEAPPDGVKLH